jgi:Cu(I)/Ag(I) efflux system protein CusF
MKVASLMLTIAVLAGCARTSPGTAQTPSKPGPASETAATPANAITASATGTVESVDVSAKTITIAHGPIAAVKWPAMTMTFDAPGVDLGVIKPGDKIDFDMAINGMRGTVVKVTRR